jgi:hypothetical protein
MARSWQDLFVVDGAGPEAEDHDAEAASDRPVGRFRRLRENLRKTRQALSAEIQATLFEELDDANIGRFVELLRSYSDRAQFIVVTHQKKTMEAADIHYGVTMGGDAVSQIVSRRLPREEHVSAVA